MSAAFAAPVGLASPPNALAAAACKMLPPAPVEITVSSVAVTACASLPRPPSPPLFVVCVGVPPMTAAAHDDEDYENNLAAAAAGSSSGDDDVSDTGSTLLTAPGSPPPDDYEQQIQPLRAAARKKSISFCDVVELIEALPDEDYDRSAEPVVKLTYKDVAELMAMRSEFAKASAVAAAAASFAAASAVDTASRT
ncbi:hypothetical protein HK405_011206 [Cladochytrium tenue]|nr:hypothetical protein HK405_011206 [Cladochytrium tenue]